MTKVCKEIYGVDDGWQQTFIVYIKLTNLCNVWNVKAEFNCINMEKEILKYGF